MTIILSISLLFVSIRVGGSGAVVTVEALSVSGFRSWSLGSSRAFSYVVHGWFGVIWVYVWYMVMLKGWTRGWATLRHSSVRKGVAGEK